MAEKKGIKETLELLKLGFVIAKVAIEQGKDGYQWTDVLGLIDQEVKDAYAEAINGIKDVGTELKDIDRHEVEQIFSEINAQLDALQAAASSETPG